VSVPTVSEHLANIYQEGELTSEATIRKFLIVRTEGNRSVSRLIDHYSLPAILAIGYRVRSAQGTRFRQWATTRLDEYLIKGFVMDDERLKSAGNLGEDYFEELLERIRGIRASERRFYQKITDIYAQCSVDYDPQAEITQTFHATVQNRMHWAVHGHTAAEVIHKRADATKRNMGLTTWKGSPARPIRKTDVAVAKNHLNEKELSELNRIVGMYLDFAEDQAQRRKTMTMLFEDITISSKSDLTVCFTAYEGRRYTVKPSPTYSFLGDKRWKPAVFDERAQVFVDHPCVAAPPRAAHAPPPTGSPLAADPAANPTGPPAAPVRQKTDSE
jgi:hypothetical protein